MKTIVILSCLLAAVFALTPQRRTVNRALDEQWANFKQVHRKNYTLPGQELRRRLIWENNVKTIGAHNLLFDLGGTTYKMGLNKNSDTVIEDIAAKMNGFHTDSKGTSSVFTVTGKAIPDTVDWRTKGYVTPVKDQAECDSSFAFSAAGAIEGQNFKKTGNIISLSAQQLVDCSSHDGCNFNSVVATFDYIRSQGGINSEFDYPYIGGLPANCHFDPNAVAAKITGYTNVSRTEEALKEAVATVGPISVSVNNFFFRAYTGGIYNYTCEKGRPIQGLLVVGYGTDNGQEYWLAKNSWGTSWGEHGYIRMARNANNLCGIADFAAYPNV